MCTEYCQFFIFAGLMAGFTLVFILISWRYQYVQYTTTAIADDNDNHDDEPIDIDGTPSVPSSSREATITINWTQQNKVTHFTTLLECWELLTYILCFQSAQLKHHHHQPLPAQTESNKYLNVHLKAAKDGLWCVCMCWSQLVPPHHTGTFVPNQNRSR